ncbi:Tetratricopeptide repeat-containing protein [Thermoflexibacter ruber]|uniref:histidine kinase n=2 Tax=Thermoflexibacter ruber TaxID=1003 RepID=A0A1I2JKA9_9BACT|nr:Tetratricopeptide repeat-containing protein [Thermoflexibacter ruber]
MQDSIEMAHIYRLFGIAYYDGLKQYELAKDYSLKALKIYENQKKKDYKNIALTKNRLARVDVITYQDLKMAHQYVSQSIKIGKSLKDNQLLGWSFNLRGEINARERQYDSAIFHFEQSIKIFQERKEIVGIAYNQLQIGNVYLQQGNNEKAFSVLQQAMLNSQKANAKEFLKEAYFGLSKVYEKQADYKNAYLYQRQYYQLKDSILNQETTQQLALIQVQYEEERQKTKIALLEKEKLLAQEEKRSYLIIFAGSLFSILVVLFIVIRNNRQRAKTNIILQQKKQEIEKQNRELQQNKEEIEAHNEELRQSKEEIETQRDILTEQNKKLIEAQNTIKQQHKEIKYRNDNLEKEVDERTRELKTTVQNLLKQNQTLEQFSYIISHNLRSPVARIQGLVNVINQEYTSSELRNQLLQHLSYSSLMLDNIIKDLTEILAVRKNLNTNKEYIDIKQLIAEELEKLEKEIQEINPLIEKQIMVISVFSAKVYLQNIFYNLMSNAIKYRHLSRRLHIIIKTSVENNHFCLSVQDNGLGVDTSDTYKIFGMYQRGHTHIEGKGLGLYLVKTQIEAMNGYIEVESTINEGSIFKVYIPL